MARSCFFAAALVLKVPRFLRLPVLRIFLPRIQSILARFQLPDHDFIEYSQLKWSPRVEFEATGSVADLRQTGGALAYKDLAERFETQSTTNAARMARLVAR